MDLTGYYNRFDKSKKYKKLMFRAGKGLQSAEHNDLQDMLLHEYGVLANTMFGDGSILKGGSLIIDGTAVTLEAATVLAKGLTHEVAAATITIVGIGTEVLGFAIKEETVTELEDPDLRDPATGTRNYHEPGAARLKLTARWCKDTAVEQAEYFYPTHTLIDGVLNTPNIVAPQLDGVKSLLARYDVGANGSYVIRGLKVSYQSDDPVAHTHIFSV